MSAASSFNASIMSRLALLFAQGVGGALLLVFLSGIAMPTASGLVSFDAALLYLVLSLPL